MSSQTIINWLLMAALSLGMAVLWDQPSETDIAALTAQVAADVNAEEHAMRGPHK